MKIVDLNVCLGWPYGKFKHLGSLCKKLTKYKAWELEHYYYTGMIVNLEMQIAIREDHSGLSTTIGLFGYSIRFTISDTRHWDHNNNCYN